MLVSLRVKIVKSDQHLISPCDITFELFIKIVRIKETITNQKSLDRSTNSNCQYQRKCKEGVWRISISMLGCKGFI